MRFESGFDVECYGLEPATTEELFEKVEGLEDVIRGLKKFKESRSYRKFSKDFALVAKIFRTNGDTIWQLVDEYELKDEEK